MSRFIETLLANLEPVRQPRELVLVAEHALDRRRLEILERDSNYLHAIKSDLAHQLAQAIVENTQLFTMPSYAELRRGVPVRIELIINDAGTAKNYLPRAKREARDEGFQDGRKSTLATLPYGMDPNEIWE